MAVRFYVIGDKVAIEYMMNNDLDGFKEYLEENPYLDFGEAESFETEAEALAFGAGLGYGADDRGMVDVYPLYSSEEADLMFIEAIEQL